ncbi:MAG: DNA polymerase III subunit delta [Thiothrix sp.]|nr:DNA polymerase III subunit delta [Thiothrix sp.]HPE60534.1 DNA polymerase III subunit delta [Thiolinea sp.]
MQVRADQIDAHLTHGLKPVYLVSGDEPLQLMEVAGAIIKAAVSAGYADRVLLQADNPFDWSSLALESGALSLFAERKLLDLRLQAKPGAAGGKALQQYLKNPPSDKILLIRCGRLDRSGRNAGWVKAVLAAGVMVQVWPLSAAQTQGWVARRMRAAGLRADEPAVRYLSDRIEGNLLAADQEIKKLQLLHGSGSIGLEQVLASVADSSRFSVFDLAEAVLGADPARIRHILQVQQQEGSAMPLLVWALADLLRQLDSACRNQANGRSFQALLQRMPKARQALFQQAVRRMQVVSPAGWAGFYRRLALLDQHGKGVGRDVPRQEQRLWDELLDLALRLAGQSLSGAGKA